MSSRRRNSRKNIGTSLSEIQRRLRRMERKPIRTRLQNRVIKGAAIAPSSITADEVEFGTTVITAEDPADVIVNPKEGLLAVNPDTGEGKLYSEEEGGYVDIKDAAARTAAQDAADAAAAAQSDATEALADAATAYTAATNSLQPSANTIVNASNQMTAINSTGITVYSGASATSGARIVLNSTGLAGFNVGGTATFSISATTGAAVFSGSVTGSTITASTMNIGGNAIIDATGLLTATGATITGTVNATAGYFGTAVDGFSISSTGLVGVGAGTIIGGTITGAVIRQAASGTRIEMDAVNPGRISFYGSTTNPGMVELTTDPYNGLSTVIISSPYDTGSPGYISLAQGNSTSFLNIKANAGVLQTGSLGLTYLNDVSALLSVIRNIGASTVLPAASSVYNGSVYLVYT
jgi:hypothetical protein